MRGGPRTTTRTTCPYCGVGCGVLATPDPDGVTIQGDPDHPANFGRLCSKGLRLGETVDPEDRILTPQIGGREVDWDTALNAVAAKFRAVIHDHGPDAVAFYVSGQCLTEDYYVANKLMKGYIGASNIDTNSRLCMASSVAGHVRAFGSDTVPGCYEDLELADLVVLTGSNMAWCHPVLFQRLRAAKAERPSMRLVVIDPRETASCELADLHLPLAPGSDVALFQGLLRHLARAGCTDRAFANRHTTGLDAVLASADAFDLEQVAARTRLNRVDIRTFYDLVANTPQTVTVYSQGVNQARDGADRVNAILNTHLLTGRIGTPGAGPFSVTGQPNAMGGREVGGLANQLASHIGWDRADLVQRYWNSPAIPTGPGLKAVDLFEAIHAGKVKAVWIMATNPVVSMPDADRVKAALARCEMVVVSDLYHHADTARCADILLPSTGWGEKDGTVTNSERRISRQRAFLPAPEQAKHDWWQLCEVAKRMGYDGFDFDGPADIFREYAGLCAFENDGARDLDLSDLKDVTQGGYDALAPRQWPLGRARLFADGQFFTPDRKARFVAPDSAAPIAVDPDYPLTLNSGRIRDQWHTMTRTGRSSHLSSHLAEPFAEIHPLDADAAGLANAQIARLISRQGDMLARVLITRRAQPGSVFVPMHFTAANSSRGRADALVHSVVDPVSGQPALKSTPVRIERFQAHWFGFLSVAADAFHDVDVPEAGEGFAAEYWAKARTQSGVRVELAGSKMLAEPERFLEALLARSLTDPITTCDSDGTQRIAAFEGGRLVALLYLAREPVAVSRDWASEQVGRTITPASRIALLAGRPGADAPDKGRIVCSCESVGINQIRDAVASGCRTVASIGARTRAGTNCGSCQPELKSLLGEVRLVAAE